MILRILLWLVLLPVQLLLWATFCLSELIRLPSLPFRGKSKETGTPQQTPGLCSIIVLNWNGKHLLQESVPALKTAIEFTGADHEVIVVDNGSEDDSCSWLAENHPWVRVLPLESNFGFGEGNNQGVESASHPIVVLLNNDMIVSKGFLRPLLEPFSDPQVFAVSSQIYFPKGKRREETGNTKASWAHGYLHLAHAPVRRAHVKRKVLPVLWAGGGSSAFDKRRFLELGGFSHLFSPCYVEDTDLSYRAWRRGWKVLIAAKSKVLHKHRSSSRNRFQEQEIQDLIEQRKLWYIWKNYQLRTLWNHLLWFPLNLRNHVQISTYLKALLKVPAVLMSRIAEPARNVSDRQLFRWVGHPVDYLNSFHPDRIPTPTQNDRLKILIVSAYLPHLGKHGGAGRVFQLLARVAQHHDVSLACFIETKKELAELHQVAPYCKRIETVLRREYEPVSLFPYEPFEEFNCPSFRERLEKLLAEEDFDLVHFEWTQMVAYGDLFLHTPQLVTEIEVNYAAHQSLVRVEPKPIRKIKRHYDTLQTLYREVEACRKVDKVICVTDADLDFLNGYVATEKLDIVNTGVDTNFFKPAKKNEVDPDAIVYVGAFRHSPNIDAMLFFTREVFPTILEERPETQLYIVGSSPPAVIRRLAEDPNITVTGFVEDIRDYYALAQVVIVPLRTGVGIRGKILEGWAAGKAMVATSLACLGIQAIHGENIIISDEPEDFARWTLALLRNPDHCSQLGQAGRNVVVRDYEWDQLGLQMTDIYSGMVERTSNIPSLLESSKKSLEEALL